RTLAEALLRVQREKPAVVAIDIVLPDSGDPAETAALEKALASTPSLILGSGVLPGGKQWEDPHPVFREHAEAIGHVHAAPDPVSRKLPLEVVANRDRRWAMALEALRLREGGGPIEESPDTLAVGTTSIPARRETGRAMYILYALGIPQISVVDPQLQQVRGKVVFIGVTAQSAARDRLMTPMGDMMSGVEMHAQAYETLSRGR